MRYIVGLMLALCVPFALGDGAIYGNLDSGWAQQSGLPTAHSVGASSLNQTVFPSVWSGDIGYNHNFAPYIGFGAQAGGGLWGKARYTFSNGNSTVKSQVISFLGSLLGQYKKADFIFDLGLARVNTQVSGLNADSHSRPHIEIGGGTAYNITRHIAIQATYLHIFGNSMNSLTDLQGTPEMNAVLTGVRITF